MCCCNLLWCYCYLKIAHVLVVNGNVILYVSIFPIEQAAHTHMHYNYVNIETFNSPKI
jgi:hypothetical protein